MEPDLVDPVAVPVDRDQLRFVSVGEPSVFTGLRGAGDLAELLERVEDALVAKATYGRNQRRIAGHDVVANQ
jgi:hypothetical protein